VRVWFGTAFGDLLCMAYEGWEEYKMSRGWDYAFMACTKD
jgi:hypothetical protein